MNKKQPEALRLADYIEKNNANDVWKGTAAELRRLHEVETKYHESIGGFKRDLAEKLEQQRSKNKRLTDELRRLHEVNAKLLEALKEAEFALHDCPYTNRRMATAIFLARTAIAKATGEQR